MNDRQTAQPLEASGASSRTGPDVLRDDGSWETARHDPTAPPRPTTAPGDEGAMALWIAALCLCLRRYGAPETAALTVLTGDRDGKITTRHRIDLTFADTIRAVEWRDAVRLPAHAEAAPETGVNPEREPGQLDGWRVALILQSDLPPAGHEVFASFDRLFTVHFSSGMINVSAGRKKTRRTDDWPLPQMVAHWEQLVKGLEEMPEEPVGRLSVLTPAEQDAIIRTYEKPREAIANPRFGFELFDDQVVLTPGAPAVTEGDETISYHQLRERSNRLAHHLQKLGVGPETIVGVFLERSIDLVVAVIGLQKAGGAYLPIDPGYPVGRLEYLVSDSRVSVIITREHLAPKLPPGAYCTVLVDREADAIAAMSAEKPAHGLKPGNMAFVFYTSGSTGQPKGVIMPHGVRAPFDRTKVEPDNLAVGEKVLLKSAVGFTLILREIFWPLHWGGHLVVVPQGSDSDSAYLVRAMRDHKVVGANFVPSMLSLLVEEPDLEQCQSLRLIYTVGESLAVDVQRRLFARLPAVRLFVFYGCTEAPAATFRECRPDEPYGNRIVIGKPMANKKVYLLDRNFVPVPPGVAGEIHTGGAISRGYLHRPDLTADRFIPNPFSEQPGERVYRTGDLARRLPDGNFEFLGRADFQVQVRGIRVELGEIEAAIAAHPAIKEVLVMADPRHLDQTRLIAYYTERESQRVSVADLRSLLHQQLPEYMVPTSFTRLDVFPLNANGKVDRRNLPEPNTAATASDHESVPPRTAEEVRLAGIWAQVLGIDHFGMSDRFFDLGGDSMLAARAVARINHDLGTELSLPDFYREPTIEALARLLFGKASGTGLRLFLPISTEGHRRPVFMTNPYPSLARHFGPDQPFYGMKGHWLDARFDYRKDVPAIVRDYLPEMTKIQPAGPYVIFGFSMGGLFAVEMARQLEAAGQKVDCLLLLDPTLPVDELNPASTGPAHPPAPPGPSGWWQRHRAGLHGLSAAQKLGYIGTRLGAFTGVFQKYWTRSQLLLGRTFNAIGRDVPFRLRERVATHYYSRIRLAYQPTPLRSQATVYLLAGHEGERVAMLRRLFPAGVELRHLDTKRHLDVMTEPHLSRWMAELKRTLADAGATEPVASVASAAGTLDTTAPVAPEPDSLRQFRIVQNGEGQFSAWPVGQDLPAGWTGDGFQGVREACLAHIRKVWTDLRPASLR